MLWVDKHRPRKLDKLSYHPKITQRLKQVALSGNMPHLLVYGPAGSGKKTRVMALLREMFGPGVEKVKLEHRTLKVTSSNRKVDVTMLGSAYHIEINPSDAGNYDRHVVQEIIKEMAASHPLHAGGSISGGIKSALANAASNASLEGSTSSSKQSRSYKVLILTEVDSLTQAAQAALRRTMEKYASSCRLVLLCRSPCRVIEPLRSRCLGVRVASPTVQEVNTAIMEVARKEQINLPAEMALHIAKRSKRSIRRALLTLEGCKAAQYPFQADGAQQLQVPDWERYIAQMALEILKEQSPKRLLAIRAKLYELLANCIPPDVIMKTLARELTSQLDDDLKCEAIKWAAHYEHRLQLGSKEIFHLEAFVAKFMAIYKQYLVELFG